MHNFQANYNKILKVLKVLDSEMDYLDQIRKPKLRDKELIAVDLTSEYMGIDAEIIFFQRIASQRIGSEAESISALLYR